jgi:ADP-ribose pyrophosphatase
MKILDSTVIKKLKFATLFAISYQDQKGRTKQWEMVSRKERPKCITGEIQRPDAAIVVPYHKQEQKLVVIKEFRVPMGGHQFGFPAGLLDSSEDVAAAAGRELREETGLELVRIYRSSPAVFSSAGLTDESIAMVFAEVDGTPDNHHNEDSEDIEIYLMDRQEVKNLLRRREIFFGARAWLALDAYARMGISYFTGEG